jgi:uncharacterized membrane protein YkvI
VTTNPKFNTKGSILAAYTTASLWFGTHVGGGFASGNQVVQYFAQYGSGGWLIPVIAMGLLAVVMYIYMEFAHLNGFDNFKDTFEHLYPVPKMEILWEIFNIVVVLAACASAVAGAGNVLANFMGINYEGKNVILMNLVIVAILIVLTIFGIKLVMAASSILGIIIIIVTLVMIVTGFSADLDAITKSIVEANPGFQVNPDPYTHSMSSAIIRGIFVYAGFQCISLGPMIAGQPELTEGGIKKAAVIGWIMNGSALALSAAMLAKWYPLLKAMVDAQIPVNGVTNLLNVPNQTVLQLANVKAVMLAYSILLFAAFVSTCITLTYSMIQRFSPVFFPNSIKKETVRNLCVGVIVIAVCFLVSLLGLTNIIKYAYGYSGYYAIFALILPAFIWGIPKIRKLKAGPNATTGVDPNA